MGLLTAFADGASRGLSVLGDGMLRGIERDADQAIWEKRQKLLAEIQRENAKVQREDDFAFRNDPKNVQTEIGTATTRAEAAGKTARGEKVKDLTDPDLTAAQGSAAAREAARKLEEDKTRITTLAPLEAKRAGMISTATTSGRGDGDPFAKLPAAVRASYQGLAEQAKNINAAITKSQADGSWEPDKNKSQADLMVRLRATEDRAQALLKPYLPKAAGTSDDDEIAAMLRGDAKTEPTAQPSGDTKPAPPPKATDPAREAMSLRQRGQTDTRAAAQGANSAAQAALRANDPAAAQEVMESAGFDLLDQSTKNAVRKLVYGK